MWATIGAGLSGTLGAQNARAQQQTQIVGSLDVGGASVRYDEFVRAAVGNVTPAVRIERGRATVAARGAFSRFESGNYSIEAALAASIVSPTIWKLRGEFFATAANTHYSRLSNAATNLYTLGRLHLANAERGVWVGTGVGAVARGFSFPDDIVQLDAGGWTRAGPATLSVQAMPTRVGGFRYTDVLASGRVDNHGTQLSATAGYRDGDRAAGAAYWAELGAAYWLTRHLAVVGGGGVFPAELWRGLPGGRYASAALRVATQAPREADARRLAELTRDYGLGGAARSRAVARPFTVETESTTSELRAIRLVLSGASTVELMADFTNWLPVTLTSDGANVWSLRVVIPPGVHRVNVRANGGRWVAPPGLTVVRDEFGGEVGLLVVQ